MPWVMGTLEYLVPQFSGNRQKTLASIIKSLNQANG
jgi:hypothetical protein